MFNLFEPFAANAPADYMMHVGDISPSLPLGVVERFPHLKNHIDAVTGFSVWLKNSSPDVYAKIKQTRPDLLNPLMVVMSGALTRKSATGMNGLADDTPSDSSNTPAINPASSNTVTNWGSELLQTVQQIAPTYFQLRVQKQLMDTNLTRAEKGLPPIDSATLAPTVNVGASHDVQMLGYVAIGGLMLLGLFSIIRRKR